MSECEGTLALRSQLVEAGLWAKKISEGTNSLLRAVSVCLYFTERHQEVVRSLVELFFKQQWLPKLKSEAQTKTAERYLQNMTLMEFEPLNLEIVGYLFNVDPILYFSEEGSLQSLSHGQEGLPALHIFRVGEGRYWPLFHKSQEESFIFAQNIVLNLVESALFPAHSFNAHLNNDKLINFDFRRWMAQSQVLQRPPSETPADFRSFRLGPSGPQPAPLISPANDRQTADVGTEILSLLRRRKNSIRARPDVPSHPRHSFIASNFADQKIFLRTHLHHHSFKRSKSLRSTRLRPPHPFKRHELAGDWPTLDSEWPTASELQVELGPATYRTTPDTPSGEMDTSGNNGHISPVEADGAENADDAEHDDHLQAIVSKFESKSPEDDPDLAEKPKQVKVSLKEKLLKKHVGPNGRLDLSKTLSFQDPPPYPLSGRAFLTSTYVPGLERPESQKLLSELKTGLNKEKYSETVDSQYYTGNLKFFDEKNGFGFFQIVKDNDYEDVFVYKSEFDKADIRVESLKAMKGVIGHTFKFQIATYYVHSDRRKKAINIKLL